MAEGCSGGEIGAVPLVAMEREAVDHQRVAEKIEQLPSMADAVRASEPEGVLEAAVDRLGVVAAWVEPREVRIRRRVAVPAPFVNFRRLAGRRACGSLGEAT